MTNPNIERGDILLIEFNPTRGSEIQKTRPAIVITNNIANTYSPIITVIPITSQKLDTIYPHEVLLQEVKGLSKLSKANISQMRAIDITRIKNKLGKISSKNLQQIDIALKLHLNLTWPYIKKMNHIIKKSKYEIITVAIREVNLQLNIALKNIDLSHKIIMERLKIDLIKLRDEIK